LEDIADGHGSPPVAPVILSMNVVRLCRPTDAKRARFSPGPCIFPDRHRLPATAAAAAATAARTTAEAAAARTSAATIAGLVLGFVDPQGATVHRIAVERLDGARGISLRHFDETETAGAAGLPIGGQRDGLDRAVLREQRTHLGFIGRERQVAYIDLRHRTWISKQLTDCLIGDPSTGVRTRKRDRTQAGRPTIST